MDTFGNVAGIPFLNGDHELAHVGCRHRINGLVSIGGEHISFHAPHRGIGMSRRLADQPPLPPIAGDVLEAVSLFTLLGFGFLLLGLAFSLAFGHWIGPVR